MSSPFSGHAVKSAVFVSETHLNALPGEDPTYYGLKRGLAKQLSSIFSLLCRIEGPDESVPVLSVPGRRHVRLLLLCDRFSLPGPCLQARPRDMVEVADDHLCGRFTEGFSALLGVSDHDHLRGEVRVRFSAPPSDVADQNPHDGCHSLHRHSHDSGHLYDLSSQGIDTGAIVWNNC